MTALPPAIPKKAKRSSRWRSQAHLNFVRSRRCSVPDCTNGAIEAAHVRNGSKTGLAQKPDDWRAVSLCQYHHSFQHFCGEETFWRDVAMVDPEALIEAFIASSPKRFEIERARKERGE